MTKRETTARGSGRPAAKPEAHDPVAAFWFAMARNARTEGLRRLHTHLAVQRVDFVASRLRLEREEAVV